MIVGIGDLVVHKVNTQLICKIVDIKISDEWEDGVTIKALVSLQHWDGALMEYRNYKYFRPANEEEIKRYHLTNKIVGGMEDKQDEDTILII